MNYIKKNIKIIKLSGDFGVFKSNELNENIFTMIKNSEYDLFFDLEDLNTINSTGIFSLLRIYSLLRERGRKMAFISITKDVKKNLDYMGIFKIIPNFESIEDALKFKFS